MDELCIHLQTPETCSICKHGVQRKPTQAALNPDAIAEAVEDLASSKWEFTTKEVAHHPAVRAAHEGLWQADRFDQQIGTYLTNAVGRLKIVQTSPKGQSNARWRRRDENGG